MSRSLIAFDTDHIKQYVFGTGRLREIRGASALLDRLNREIMPNLVGGTCFYANGGSGLFEVDTVKSAIGVEAVARAYRQETGSASVTGVSVALPDHWADLQAELDLVRWRLRFAKDRAAETQTLCTHPLLHFCDSCGTGYAEQTSSEGEMLCASCCAKRAEDERVKAEIQRWSPDGQKPNPYRLWQRLMNDLHAVGYPISNHERPKDFETLGNLSSPSGYMGLIYADGDGMGQVIETISDPSKLRDFATAVDGSVYQAVQESVAVHLRPQGPKCWPFDVLLLGGDDLVMVTRAQSAIETALYIVERFPELTKERWGTPLYLSASVVLTHVNYPIGSLLSLAESGLRFAKRRVAQHRLKDQALGGGLLNFTVVNSANHLDFEDYYQQTLRAEEPDGTRLYRTQRPYTAAEMQRLLALVRSMQGVPRTKLEQLRRAVFKSRRQGTIDAMKAVLRLRNDQQRKVLFQLVGTTAAEQLALPWIEQGGDWVTSVLDVVELLDFVPKGVTE